METMVQKQVWVASEQKVWAAAHGEYSDYNIGATFPTEDLAQQYVDDRNQEVLDVVRERVAEGRGSKLVPDEYEWTKEHLPWRAESFDYYERAPGE